MNKTRPLDIPFTNVIRTCISFQDKRTGSPDGYIDHTVLVYPHARAAHQAEGDGSEAAARGNALRQVCQTFADLRQSPECLLHYSGRIIH
jgi:hypothetical protein